MAGRQGLEPRYAEPESAVLPLDDLPVGNSYFIIAADAESSSAVRFARRIA